MIIIALDSLARKHHLMWPRIAGQSGCENVNSPKKKEECEMLNDRKANDDHRFINEVAKRKEHACRQQHYTNYYFSDNLFFVFVRPRFVIIKQFEHRICLMTFDHKLKIKSTVTNIFTKEMKC